MKDGKSRKLNRESRPAASALKKGCGAFVRVLICLVVCLSLLFPVAQRKADAETVTDDLDIKIGYWGMPEDEYVTKASFHWTDLADMYGGAENMPQIAYSYFKGKDSGSYKIVVVAARGALLEDVLNQAGVNISDIKNLSFYTNDYTEGAFASFTPYQLLEEPRYYYGDLAAHINNEYNDVGVLTGYDIDSSAEDHREPVQTMLALESNWSEYAAGAENTDPVFTGMMTSSRFRLLFGQNSAQETNMTSKSAKYVHTIAITIPGSPEIKSDSGSAAGKIMLSTEIGKHTVTFNVASDEAMIDSIKKRLEWKSSDESVLRIDDIRMDRSAIYDDAVEVTIDYEVLKKGNASISGSYMGLELSGSSVESDEKAADDNETSEKANNKDIEANSNYKAKSSISNKSKKKSSTKRMKNSKDGKSNSRSSSEKGTKSGSSEKTQKKNGENDKQKSKKKLSLTKKGGSVTATKSAATDTNTTEDSMVAMDLESVFEKDDSDPRVVMKKEDDGKYNIFIGAGAGTLMLAGGVSSLLHFSSETGGAASRLKRKRTKA